MDSDRDFAKVEKEVRLRENIYSVDEYHTIIAKSQKHSCDKDGRKVCGTETTP